MGKEIPKPQKPLTEKVAIPSLSIYQEHLDKHQIDDPGHEVYSTNFPLPAC